MRIMIFKKKDTRYITWSWLVLLGLTQILKISTSYVALADLTESNFSQVLPAFTNLWQRNDQPVARGKAARSWTWGTKPVQIETELYAEAPGGHRVVAYWDKSRMELTDPQADPAGGWYVTNGLLVQEMVSGQVQTGNEQFVASVPANIPVAGDSLEINPDAPTYASFAGLASLNKDKRAEAAPGAEVITRIDRYGNASEDSNFQGYGIRQGYYEPILGHNIPAVFMDFFKTTGLTYQDRVYKTDRLYDWVFTAGLPLTEAYWMLAQVEGQTRPVLVQLFERRVLTYNPANPAGWQVEMGNVGQHYYTWRYRTNPVQYPATGAVSVATPANFARVSQLNESDSLLEIGNSTVARRVVFSKQGGAYSSSFKNVPTAEEYLGRPGLEFSLNLALEDGRNATEITSDNFRLIEAKIINQDMTQSLAQVKLAGTFEGNPVNLSLYYEALNGQNFLRKWLVVEPFAAPGWVIKGVTLEDWQPAPELQPVKPVERYEINYPNGQPDYISSVGAQAINLLGTEKRLDVTDASTAVGQHANGREGFYFFTESLFGQESFSTASGLKLGNTDYIRPFQRFTSGRSVVGVWQGPADEGFRSYNDYLYKFYAVIKGKRDPVVYNTWFPFETGFDEKSLLDTVDRMKAAGFYDILHVDAGWQSGAPLRVDRDKFPDGLEPVIEQLKASGMTVGLWMNPFSSVYSGLENYDLLREQRPDWVDETDPQRRFCPLSGAGEYVRTRLLEIARTWPLEEIYWDGADWHINNCRSADRNWQNTDEEYHATIKYYASLLHDLHTVRPDLQVVVWNGPTNIHWLSAIDQLQLSDIHGPPVLASELIRSQQMYYATYQYPYRGLWGDWYGLSYKRTWEEGLGLPQHIIQFAEVSMVGNGASQAGASLDLAITPEPVITFLNKLFTWRKQFGEYFRVYQHILNFPDGSTVHGEAHMLDGRGIIILLNPTGETQKVDLPLAEPELKLIAGQAYRLSDWTDLSAGKSLGEAQPGQAVTLTIPGYGYQIIGINLP